jgi:hypothetical protein
VGSLTSHNPIGLYGLLRRYLYFFIWLSGIGVFCFVSSTLKAFGTVTLLGKGAILIPVDTTYLADTKDVGVPSSSLGTVEEFTHTREADEAVKSHDDGAGNTDLGGDGRPP